MPLFSQDNKKIFSEALSAKYKYLVVLVSKYVIIITSFKRPFLDTLTRQE